MPKRFVSPDGSKLGTWVDNRRSDRQMGKLSADQVARLDALASSGTA